MGAVAATDWHDPAVLECGTVRVCARLPAPPLVARFDFALRYERVAAGADV